MPISLNLDSLCKHTLSKDSKLSTRSAKSKVVGVRSRKNFRRFIFNVKSKMSYSSAKGHLVSVLFPNITISELKENKKLEPKMTRCRIWCTCPAFTMWGSANNATYYKYNITDKSETRVPKIRDPNREKLVCKHIYSVYKDIENDSFIRIYNRFKKSFYRKRDKKKKSSVEDLMYITIFNFLMSKGYSKIYSITKINELRKKDQIEEFLFLENLIV